jgi:hypothetical protein
MRNRLRKGEKKYFIVLLFQLSPIISAELSENKKLTDTVTDISYYIYYSTSINEKPILQETRPKECISGAI